MLQQTPYSPPYIKRIKVNERKPGLEELWAWTNKRKEVDKICPLNEGDRGTKPNISYTSIVYFWGIHFPCMCLISFTQTHYRAAWFISTKGEILLHLNFVLSFRFWFDFARVHVSVFLWRSMFSCRILSFNFCSIWGRLGKVVWALWIIPWLMISKNFQAIESYALCV